MKKLGKYEVLGELGHGAMGVVYRARDPFINRLVALKTITTGVADDPALLQRFYREAQSAGGLQHPNIVTIYDLGEAGALPYIAMELVEGENLEQVIARRSVLPLSLKLMYAMQACRAFDYAHKRGIVHRDIKPGNVMVNKEGTVKVVDFGIARVLETSRTQTGMLIGTFAYMSPEQYHGEHADERSDIWSFGVLLYELLSYQRPFTGPTPASLMRSICDEEPAPLAKAVPDCPKELELVVARMLRKSPLERYQSMEDVLLDLDPVYKALQSQSVTEILQQVRKLFDEGRFAEGRDLVRQALQVDSGNQQARSLLEKANAELKRIQNRPKAQQYVDKGQTLLAEGKLQEARIAMESALQLDSNFAPAEDLRQAIEQELNRARLISEWLESAKQNLAEGLPDEAQALLAKVLEAEPSHAQAQSLQQQVLKEKAEREKSRRLREGLQRAREFWTQQNHDECLSILRSLEHEFPGDEEVLRLTEAVRDDQLEQKKQQGLLQSRNLLAASRHDDAIALLAGLQKQFPTDDEIPLLIEDVRRDQLNQRRLLGLDEARGLLAVGNYDASISLLANLRQVFPADQEIPELLETAQQGQAEQVRQRGLAQARKLLSARQYKECIASLAALEKQFPRNEEILALQKAVHDQQLQQEKEQRLEQARNLLTARRYDECSALLATLEKQFPSDAEILRIQNALRDDRSKQRKLQALDQARKLLSSKNYENCVALLTSLHTEFADDQEIPKLLESARKEQVNERKRVAVADARNLLAARNYQQAVAFLNKLQSEFQNDTAIAKLLESARKEQADQRQREGLAEARKLLAARRYDESIVLLGKLAAEFPDEPDITKLLATAREDLAEQQKQQKLAEAKNLLAAQSFDQALSILDQLATAHSKDSAVTKLHALVQREQEEHTKAETIQRELDALKKLMGDKKYPEVIARTKELLHQFPTEPNFTRLAEFAASRQASIEKDLLLQKVLGEAQTLFNAGRFDECLRSAQSGLKMFPANADLQNFCQQAEIQRKKLQVRKQIEQRIREIRVKINREELSDAVDLAKQTLVTLGPDTDLTHLLNSAQVELEAREKKRIQERTLETIRTLIDSGDLDGASRTIDKVVESHTLDVFDPRIQRLADRIKDAKSAPAANPAKTPLTASPTFSKEYAFLQATPLPTAPPSPAQTPVDSAATNAPISASITSTPQYVAPDTAATTPPAREVTPEPPLVVPDFQEFESVSPPASVTPIVVPPSRPAAPVPRKVERPAPQPVSVPLWKKPAVLAIAALVLIAAIWFGLRSTPNPVVTDATKPAQPQPPAPAANPLELQQRQALEAADKLVAANDFDRALRLLQQAQALNGPLAPEIQKKSAEIVESKNNAGLRQIRQHEAELWQQALRSFRDKRYAEAQKALKGILALPAGGVRREEAQGYLEKNIPQQQAQDALSLQARKSLAQGDFASARRAAGQLSESGGNSADLIASINQAEQSQLKQLESQFDQLKQRDDDSAIQQLRALQPKLQALAADGGPRSGEALTYANSIPGAVADVRTHAEKKSADASFQQMVQRYQSAATSNDRDGLTAARGDFQSVVQNAGVHADEARKFISDINARLFALNRPPVTAPQPSVSPEPPPPVATNPNAADEASIRSALDQFNRAFAHKSEGEVKAIWPKVVKKYLQGMNEPGYTFSMALSPIGVITIAGDKAYVACNLVSTTTKPGGQKDQFTKTVRVELQKTGDHWLIVNPLEPNP